MTFLFHEGRYGDRHTASVVYLVRALSLQEKLQFILSATYQHARNLAILTALYKLLNLVLLYVRGCSSPLQQAMAGAVCGYLIFGDDNKINMQVCLCLS